jgi:periplasmic protein TonB
VWFVDKNATFLGGDLNKFSDWVKNKIQYPYVAMKFGITGPVVIQFSVNISGEICNIKIVRSQHPSLDKEAIRVIESSPLWTPGIQKGKPIKQIFVIPITFSLK